MIVDFLHRYTTSAHQLECVTEPYPEGEEGRTYPHLQSALITSGQTYISSGGNDAFTYHWSYTPQVLHTAYARIYTSYI